MFVRKISAYARLARLHQRIGIWLTLWPCLWGIAIASQGQLAQSWFMIAIFSLGAVLVRSAGCVINDIWDKNIDAQVTRTKNRPLASGEISRQAAIVFLCVLTFFALLLLLLLNQYTFYLALIFAVMIVIYPLTKRFFSVPQIILGLTLNGGALMAFSAVQGQLALSAWLLFIACFFWTLSYDTIYAHQDKKDDIKIGIHSSALTFAQHSKIHIGIYNTLMIVFLLFIGYINHLSIWFYVLIMMTWLFLMVQIIKTNLNSPSRCKRAFIANAWLGWLPLIALTFTWPS